MKVSYLGSLCYRAAFRTGFIRLKDLVEVQCVGSGPSYSIRTDKGEPVPRARDAFFEPLRSLKRDLDVDAVRIVEIDRF